MRAVIQRVLSASVSVEGKSTGSINAGLLILLGIEHDDEIADAIWLATKIASLRIFSDDEGLMNLSVKAVQGGVLVVSQFTLHAKTKKGNRPSFILSARPEKAIPLYACFIDQMNAASGAVVQTGRFGAMMQVELVNDGPVTIIIDTKNKE